MVGLCLRTDSRCLFRSAGRLNAFGQYSHLCCFDCGLCILSICWWRLCFRLKVRSHVWQIGFSESVIRRGCLWRVNLTFSSMIFFFASSPEATGVSGSGRLALLLEASGDSSFSTTPKISAVGADGELTVESSA